MTWALASLRVGDPGAVLPRLRELVDEHPLVESLAAVYMRALYAVGRPADALNQYTTSGTGWPTSSAPTPAPSCSSCSSRS